MADGRTCTASLRFADGSIERSCRLLTRRCFEFCRQGGSDFGPVCLRVLSSLSYVCICRMFLSTRSTHDMQPKNTICLWFDKDAQEAARFYAETFPESKVTAVHKAP